MTLQEAVPPQWWLTWSWWAPRPEWGTVYRCLWAHRPAAMSKPWVHAWGCYLGQLPSVSLFFSESCAPPTRTHKVVCLVWPLWLESLSGCWCWGLWSEHRTYSAQKKFRLTHEWTCNPPINPENWRSLLIRKWSFKFKTDTLITVLRPHGTGCLDQLISLKTAFGQTKWVELL